MLPPSCTENGCSAAVVLKNSFGVACAAAARGPIPCCAVPNPASEPGLDDCQAASQELSGWQLQRLSQLRVSSLQHRPAAYTQERFCTSYTLSQDTGRLQRLCQLRVGSHQRWQQRQVHSARRNSGVVVQSGDARASGSRQASSIMQQPISRYWHCTIA